MGDLGADYAGGRPGGAALAAAGYRFACRYLTDGGPTLPGKLLTSDELADLLAHGIAVVCAWETTADRMRAGAPAGRDDGAQAAAVLARLGIPSDRPVYFAADWDAAPDDQPAIDAYLGGAAEQLGPGRVGVYGDYWVVGRCLTAGSAARAWQTLAWSGGHVGVDPRVDLLQRIGTTYVAGVPCDTNESLTPDYGQYPSPEVAMLPDDVWAALVADPYPNASPPKKLAGTLLGWAATHAALGKEQAIQNGRDIAALDQSVTQLAAAVAALQPETLQERITAAVEAAMAGTVHVTVAVTDPAAAAASTTAPTT